MLKVALNVRPCINKWVVLQKIVICCHSVSCFLFSTVFVSTPLCHIAV